jgi:hypothetical protein
MRRGGGAIGGGDARLFEDRVGTLAERKTRMGTNFARCFGVVSSIIEGCAHRDDLG